jgi:DNA-binding Lrp family transcriptional regulator
MERVYIFISAEPGKLWDVAKIAATHKGVKMADAVTGEFDVVICAELNSLTELSGLIKQLQSIHGVMRTRTSIAIPFESSPLL